jgi:hypothetical protein
VDVVLTIVGAAAGLGSSIWLGYLIGKKARTWPEWSYWVANGVGLAIGVGAATLGQQYGQMWLWVAGLCVMGGSLTGLKYGLGRSVGAWKLVDRA